MSVAGRGQFDNASEAGDPLALQEVIRRLQNTVRVGTVEEIDYKKKRVRVKLGPLKSNWVPWHEGAAGADTTWSPPHKGEQVTMLSPSGDLAQGVVIRGLYQDKHDAPSDNPDERVTKMEDGTVITHNVKTKTRTTKMPDDGVHVTIVGKNKMTVNKDGMHMENENGTFSLNTDGTTTWKSKGVNMDIA